jgi:glycosyltransferase involved in cell wall biosynthesis
MFGITILIPTYNRATFAKLCSHNISNQTYPSIEKVIVADDGDIPLQLSVPYPVEYHRLPRCDIGSKRNYLKSKSKSTYSCFMDDDDFYHKDYIANSIFNLISNNADVSGCADMTMFYKDEVYIHSCCNLNMLNEATLCFRTDYEGRFSIGTGEGREFLKHLAKVAELSIEKIMMCVVHSGNTIPKEKYAITKLPAEYLLPYQEHIKILKSLDIV